MKSTRILLIVLAIIMAVSCSTTRVLQEGEMRLESNEVVVHGENRMKSSELQPYIKQKANEYYIGKWNPFLYVYNWSGGNDTGWDRFVEKLGQEPVVYDPGLVLQSVDGMLNHLEYCGYYYSNIDFRTRINDRKVTVHYDVTPGKRYPIANIDYQVDNDDLAKIISADSVNFTLRKGDYLSEQALENESERLAELFRNNGYYGFSKNYFYYYADTVSTPGSADLLVKIEDFTRNETEAAAKPHRKFTIRNVDVIPQEGLKVKESFLSDLNLIEPNSLYDESSISRTYDRFTSIPIFSTVNVQLDEVDSTDVDCRILLTPSKLQSVKASFEGSFNSNGLFGLAPSLNYSHKNIFGGGETLNVGVGADFQFMFKDPIHSDEVNLSAGIVFPQFLFLPSSLFRQNVPSTEIKGAYSYQARPEYTRNIITFSYGYTWNVNRRHFYQFTPATASVFSIPKIDTDFYDGITDPYLKNSFRNHLDIGGSMMYYFTTNSSVNPKTTYFYTRVQFDASGNLLSLTDGINGKTDAQGAHLIGNIPYAQYIRTEIQTVETLRFGSSDQFALAGRLLAGIGYAYGNSMSLPFEKLFYAGGASSLRGWQARSVGPGSAPRDESFSIVNQTGDMHLEANMELRFPLFSKLQGGLFVDAGNIWNLGYADVSGQSRDERGIFAFDRLIQSSALDWGLGVRLDIDMLLVRLDMGLKTYNPVTQTWCAPRDWFSKGGYALHFGIGYPF